MPPRGIAPVEIFGAGGASGSATFDGLTDVNPAGKADTYVVTWDAGSGKYKVLPASGGAPASASYVTTAAEAGLSAETLITAYLMPPDILANRPAAGTAGRIYFTTDTNAWYYDTSSTWTAMVPSLPNVGPGATGPIGDATHVPVVTIDAKGRITGLTSTSIVLSESAITGLVSDLAAKAPLASPVFTGTVTIPTGASITAPTGLVKGDVGLGNVDNTSNATERAAAATLANKALTSPVINTGVSGTAIDVDATMAANSDTLLASQKATKTALAGKQPLDSDLTDVAALTHADNDFIQAKAGHWTNRTVAQVQADLGIGTPLALLTQVLAGMTIPTSSLDKWKVGRGLPYTRLNGAINNSVTSVTVRDPQFFPTTMHEHFYVDQEEMFSTAGEAAAQITAITSVASTGIFTKTAHGLVAGQIVVPINGILDSFLAYLTPVYVSATNLTSSTFSLSATSGGAVLTGATNDTALTFELATVTVATRGSVNGTTAVAHADKAVVTRRRYKSVVAVGDSIVEGVDITPQVHDGWVNRAFRMMGDQAGGLIASSWPMWRRSDLAQANQEYNSLPGSAGSGTGLASDVGWGGGIVFLGGTSNGFTWTRPAGLRVRAVDIMWIDTGSPSAGWSYSLDGGTTWINNPTATVYSSGVGILRRVRVLCNDPTDIRVRAANAAGTTNNITLPYTPLTTWATCPQPGVTEGLAFANLGAAGAKLRTFLNARCVTDGVANGTTTIQSATAAFVSADAGSTIYLNGVARTIASVTDGTHIVLSGATVATATGIRLSIFQNDGTGDRMANFLGHPGSWFPDLVLIGPWTNDIISSGGSNGDGNSDFYGDMMDYLVAKVQPVADVLLIAPHEKSFETGAFQAPFRAAMHTVATNRNCAILDLYDAFSAYGFTGYTAVNAGGYMIDGVHFAYKGNNWIGSHLRRVMSVI